VQPAIPHCSGPRSLTTATVRIGLLWFVITLTKGTLLVKYILINILLIILNEVTLKRFKYSKNLMNEAGHISMSSYHFIRASS